MPTFELGISSSDAITLFPEFSYEGGKKQIRSDHRTKSGRMYRYTWGDYDRFKFDLEWVAGTDASVVNSWWESDTELLFFITSSTATEVHSVMIMNNESPLRSFNKPYDDYYRGKAILLETY
jgi:hypothetical protein